MGEAALPDTLLEAELLGTLRGAFTGADRDRTGLIEEANGGTLFLDEIAEASPGLQAKLLRVLQERKVRPLGARSERAVDVRIVAATHRDLRRDVADKSFRADLYYRLRVLPVVVSPLRERVGDITELVEHFLSRFSAQEHKPTPTITSEALERLRGHYWPGNVRELENEMHRAVALHDHSPLGPEDFDIAMAHDLTQAREAFETRTPGEPLRDTLDRVERWIVRRSLDAHAGRRADTARHLGITREGLYKKMKRLGIE